MTHTAHRPRVLHVIPSLEGGAGIGTLEMVRRLQQANQIDVKLCVLGDPPTHLAINDEADVEFLNAPVHVRSTFLRRQLAIRSLVKTWKPDCLHSHLWPSAFAVGLSVPSSLPHLIHIRDTPPSLNSQRWGARSRKWFLRRIALRKHTRLVAVSTAAAQYTCKALRLSGDRVTVVLNGAELDRFLAISDLVIDESDPIVLVSAGRLIADKGFDILIKAFSRLDQDKRLSRLLIAGRGSAEEDLRTLGRALGVEDRVEFVGQISDMPELFSRASLYVHASVAAEGLSRSLMEAQAAGRPIVSSHHPGADEAIEHQVTGLIVPPDDSTAMAAAIDSLIRDPQQMQAMGAAARIRAARLFSAERVVAEIETLYHEMLKAAS